jgi:peptidase A4-like protein
VQGGVTNRMREKSETSWRTENKRPRTYLTLAVAVMAIAGFGFAGALVAGAAIAGPVTKSLGALHTNAQKISPDMAKLLHVKSKVMKPGSPSASIITTTSTNWGGYADTISSGTILESFGEWFVPAISCNVYPSLNDNWVGIDGFGSGTVEQGGTYAYCTSTGAGPYYWTWWEFYPYNSIQSYSSSVSPGDLIQAYILYNPYIAINGLYGVYTIVVQDMNNPAASLMVQGNPSTCNGNGCESGPDTSVECISESLVGQGYYLPDYGTTTFYSCDAEINGHYSGIGALAGAGATIYNVKTIGYSSGLVQQVNSKLTTYDYPKDKFTITWKRYY